MDKQILHLEIIRKVLMLTTNKELQDMREYVSNAISRECDEDDQGTRGVPKVERKSS